MDLRQIMNSDGAGGNRPPPNPTHPTLAKQVFQPPSAFKERPPQPPPLQPPSHHLNPRSPTGSSSYGSAQSPYQHSSASTLSSGGRYSAHLVASPSPGHGHQHPPYPARDGYTSNAVSHTHNQQFTPSSASPYTPPASGVPPPYYQHQRSQSAQSVATPNSTQSQPPYPYRDVRDSPISPAPAPHSQSNPYQPLHPQQQSQPGTPLGPPQPYPRQSPSAGGHPHGGYDPTQPPSSSPYSTPRFNQPDEPRYSPKHTLPSQSSQLNHQSLRQYSTEREKSMSVSPKTVPSQIRSEASRSPTQSRDQQTPVRRDYFDESEQRRDFQRPVSQGFPTPTPFSVNPSLDSRPTQSPDNQQKPPPAPPTAQPPTIPSPSSQQPATSPSTQIFSTSQQEQGLKRDTMARSEPTSSTQPPKKRRRRDDAIPIFAQKANKSSSSSPLLPNKRQPPAKTNISRGGSHDPTPPNRQASVPPNIKEESNGQGANIQQGMPRLNRAFSVDLSNQGPLGPWEPSITNVIPYEDLTRTISDFLFHQVVQKSEFDSSEGSQSATFEIEAKIGHLIDKDINERIKLPVETECVVSRNAPNLRIAFESSMTLNQHKELNSFLNKAVVDAKPPPPGAPPTGKPPRVEIFYAHKKEIDRFYELTENGIFNLPPLIRKHMHPKHKPRVRITTDTKTGKEIARIIKIRIVDLDVHSPRTVFDWRISVNLEANFIGDPADLVDPATGRGPRVGNVSDRFKDRVSYRHLAYQIDLTQVKSAEGAQGKLLEHELEVEISPQQVREQGQLAMTGKPNQYEDLIKGFVDNVRNLVRAVKTVD